LGKPYIPKKLLLGGFLLFCILASPCSGQAEQIREEEVPMYGAHSLDESPDIKDFRGDLSQGMTAGGRKAAARAYIEMAWRSYNQKDPQAAMRRFNGAWLLDPDEAEVFSGSRCLCPIVGKQRRRSGFTAKPSP